MLSDDVKLFEAFTELVGKSPCAHEGCTKVGVHHVSPGRKLCDAHLVKRYPPQMTWPDIEARNEAEDNSPARQHPEGY